MITKRDVSHIGGLSVLWSAPSVKTAIIITLKEGKSLSFHDKASTVPEQAILRWSCRFEVPSNFQVGSSCPMNFLSSTEDFNDRLFPLVLPPLLSLLASIQKLRVTRKGCLSALWGTIQREGLVMHYPPIRIWYQKAGVDCFRPEKKEGEEEEVGTNNYPNLPCARHKLSH